MTTCDDETASRASKGPPSSLTVSKFKWLLVSESGHSDVERDLNAFEGLDPSYGGSDLCHGEPKDSFGGRISIWLGSLGTVGSTRSRDSEPQRSTSPQDGFRFIVRSLKGP